MSADQYVLKIRNVILEYIKPSHATLDDMAEITQRITGEEADYTRWHKVADEYSNREWSKKEFREFLQIAKEVVEGGIDEIAETYFDIIDPEDVSSPQVASVFSSNKWNSDNDKMNMSISIQEYADYVGGDFVYTSVNTDISNEFEYRRLVNSKIVPFRIEPSDDLLVVETTSAPRVQRLRGALNHETPLHLDICGDLTLFPGTANEKVEAFMSAFTGDGSDGPSVERVREVDMYNPDTESGQIKKIDYQGGDDGDIFDDETIRDRRDEGWIIRGFLAMVEYENDVFEVKIAGTSQMGYAKIANIDDIQIANELMDLVRVEYLEHLT